MEGLFWQINNLLFYRGIIAKSCFLLLNGNVKVRSFIPKIVTLTSKLWHLQTIPGWRQFILSI